jgi:glutaredoxin
MESITVKELRIYARKLGISCIYKYKKAGLIKVIKKNKVKCPVGKIRNPLTNRCVSKSGKIGLSLVNNSSRKSIRNSSTRTKKSNKSETPSWEIYTKKGCYYCEKAKLLLTKHGLPFKSVEIKDSNRDSIYKKIDEKTDSYRYFPVIFKNKKFIGGYTEIEKILI